MKIRRTDPERDAADLERAQLAPSVAELDDRLVGESYALSQWWHSGDTVQVCVAVRE